MSVGCWVLVGTGEGSPLSSQSSPSSSVSSSSSSQSSPSSEVESGAGEGERLETNVLAGVGDTVGPREELYPGRQ